METTATPAAIWRQLADVTTWQAWNQDIEKIEIDGPFTGGAVITMTPVGQQPILLRLVEVAENEVFVDEAQFDGALIRTAHRIVPLGDGRSRVTYHTLITGPAADQIGPRIGPAITADFPQTIAALVSLAEAG